MDIAIVGGGAAAVGLLDALATTGPDTAPGAPDTVTVFEPSPHLWRGRPYGPDLDAVLVNTPPALMSIRGGDFGHFAAWLGERGADHLDALLGQPLVPRALYGEYLVHSAEKAIATLGERGCAVRVVAARVTDAAVRSDTRLALRTDDGQEHDADRVVLCVGGGTPPDLYGLAGHPGYTADPYPLAVTLDHITAGDDVAILGSGLTAVDIVAALAARGYPGRITLLSRSGILPYVWQRPTGRRPTHVTADRVTALHATRGHLTLDDLVGLAREELAAAGEDFDDLVRQFRATSTDDPIERLRHQIAAVDDSRIGRRVVQETAHTVGPHAWRLLPEPDRARLRRHLRTATSIVSPMVPVNASTLLRLMDSGQLTITPGLEAITPVNGQFRIQHTTGHRTTPTVVNAINPPAQAVSHTAQPLIHSLTTAALATPHPAGGVIPCDPRLHIVGDLSAGASFITSSIAAVAAQSSHTATALRTP